MSSSSQVSLEMMKESGISGAGLSVRQGNIASRRAPRDQMSTLRLQYEQTEIFISKTQLFPPDPTEKSVGSVPLTKSGVSTLRRKIDSSPEGLLNINVGFILGKNH